MVTIRIKNFDDSPIEYETSEMELQEFIEEEPNPEEVEIIGVDTGDDEDFDDYLDEFYGDFVARNYVREGNRFGGITAEGPRFSASRVFKELDPTFYRIARSEWEDREVEMAREDLESQVETEEEQSWIDTVFRNW